MLVVKKRTLNKSASLKESDDSDNEVEEKEGRDIVDPLANMKDLIGSDSSPEEKKPRKKAAMLSSSDEE